MKVDLKEEIEIPEGVTVQVNETLHVKGPKGELNKKMFHPKVNIKVEGNKVVLQTNKATKREAKVLFSFKAHLANMFKGVQEPFVYKLKICSGHFPMNVSMSGKKIIIKNFIGEKHPRETTIQEGVTVKIEGSDITVESNDIELAGNMAGKLELLTAVANRDRRIFQDGIYITSKLGRELQ